MEVNKEDSCCPECKIPIEQINHFANCEAVCGACCLHTPHCQDCPNYLREVI